jgi:hypothetical protein
MFSVMSKQLEVSFILIQLYNKRIQNHLDGEKIQNIGRTLISRLLVPPIIIRSESNLLGTCGVLQ